MNMAKRAMNMARKVVDLIFYRRDEGGSGYRVGEMRGTRYRGGRRRVTLWKSSEGRRVSEDGGLEG
jgi:hypothetical protein